MDKNKIMTNKKFYVTTPIYYVTAKPHLGSLYSTLLADVAARWYKLKNYKTFFLTGTDEHGQKVAQAALKANKSPKDFVDSFIDAYKQTWHNYEIDYDYFIRTTDENHVKAVQKWIKDLINKGDIYKSFYSGFYCTPCETYITEKDEIISANEGEIPNCPSCGRPTIFVSEESYFFKLSKYQDRLLKFYEDNPDFIVPKERFNEVISFVKSGLKDLSISRTTIDWGIPFEDDPKHVTYVWADALNNYITAIGYGQENKKDEFKFFWPADMQILGKDILRFHAVYWPAFLMATDLEMPKKLLVHGWIKVNNQKMSKSFSNVIDPEELLKTYGADPIRYYLVRHMAITQDSDFSILDLEQRISSDLANDLGNLLNRMVALASKKNIYEIKSTQNLSQHELDLRDAFWSTLETFELDMQEGYFSRALASLWKYINQVNAYFHSQEPWKIKDQSRFEEVISATCNSLYSIAILLWPVMPTKSETLLKSIGISLEINKDLIEDLNDNPWNRTFMLHKIENLFEKFETETKENIQEQKVSSKEEPIKSEDLQEISIDDFAKIALLVGTIENCEEISGSDKLLKLKVNFGSYGIRQILSGVKKHFSPEDLISKQAVFVYNLAPRKMMGLESQGMLLTAQDENGKLNLVLPANKVSNGTRLK